MRHKIRSHEYNNLCCQAYNCLAKFQLFWSNNSIVNFIALILRIPDIFFSKKVLTKRIIAVLPWELKTLQKESIKNKGDREIKSRLEIWDRSGLPLRSLLKRPLRFEHYYFIVVQPCTRGRIKILFVLKRRKKSNSRFRMHVLQPRGV